jgi:hypothetical protein
MNITTYKELDSWVQGFGTRAISLLIIKGHGGIGKTYVVEKSLKEYNPIVFKGHATPLSIYQTLSENPHSIVIFDDVDELMKNKTNVALLKQLCDTKEDKQVYYATTKAGVNPMFISNNKVIMLFNDMKVLGNNMKAVMTRAIYLNFSPSSEEILKTLKGFAEDTQVLKFLEENINKIDFNFRIYTKCLELKDAGLDFRTYLKSEFELNSEEDLINEIKNLPQKERDKLWTHNTGKSVRSLQRKIREFNCHKFYDDESRINSDKTTKRQLIENVSISKAKRQENKNVCEVEK